MYLRLTTTKLDQDLFNKYNSDKNQETLRKDVIKGAYVFNSNINVNDTKDEKRCNVSGNK